MWVSWAEPAWKDREKSLCAYGYFLKKYMIVLSQQVVQPTFKSPHCLLDSDFLPLSPFRRTKVSRENGVGLVTTCISQWLGTAASRCTSGHPMLPDQSWKINHPNWSWQEGSDGRAKAIHITCWKQACTRFSGNMFLVEKKEAVLCQGDLVILNTLVEMHLIWTSPWGSPLAPLLCKTFPRRTCYPQWNAAPVPRW